MTGQHEHLVVPVIVATVCRVGGVELGVTAHPHDHIDPARPEDGWNPWPVIVDPTIPRRLRVDRITWPEHEQVGPLPDPIRDRIRGGRP
ncbi:hypothetical protein [Mobilicoccus caccae]|uniref:Secreted protein n=1 Tax=Mobilicoccus caccae TaxID=1859295 RepID=A0ABQ6ISS1_9MICO|nr:hypothetical protein [Mobilicoccus caccae]GMA40202.1 hypothetical protein GCM10025883_22470 [Mobilicoccus caccae]